MEKIEINIARDYSDTPGARYCSDGPFSGEDFRNKFLEPHFSDPSKNYQMKIILDGAEGYPTSFLEEAFGGIARKYGIERCLNRIEIISDENTLLIEEIKQYISDANKQKR